VADERRSPDIASVAAARAEKLRATDPARRPLRWRDIVVLLAAVGALAALRAFDADTRPARPVPVRSGATAQNPRHSEVAHAPAGAHADARTARAPAIALDVEPSRLPPRAPQREMAVVFALVICGLLLFFSSVVGALHRSRRRALAEVASDGGPSWYSGADRSARIETVLGDAESELWRRGDVLVAYRDSEFPPRCVGCNAPAEYVWPQTFRWHPARWYWAYLGGDWLGGLLIARVTKTASFEFGLCAEHDRRERRGTFALCASIAATGVCCALAFMDVALLATVPCGFAGLIASLVHASVRSSRFRVKRMDDAFAEIRGAGEPFLASLPEAALLPAASDDSQPGSRRAA
jgi:hypothetical protein